MHRPKIRYHGNLYVEAKGAEPARKERELKPDEYHQEHGRCPEGFHWDGKHCVPTKGGPAKTKEEKAPAKGKDGKKKVEPTPKTHPHLFTKSGRRLFVQPNPKAKIEVNPEYDEKADNTYYAKSYLKKKDGKVSVIRHYTRDYVIRNKRQKFAHNQALATKLPKVRQGYAKDLKSDDPDKKYHALAVALADQAYMRVGNAESEKERDVRGLHNLQMQHVQIGKDGSVTFAYTGKHKVQQRHVILDKHLTGLIKELAKGKGKSDYLFSWKNKDGKQTHMSPEGLNKYLQDDLGCPTTIHKFRSFHATRMAQEALTQPVPEDVKKDDKKFLKHFRGLIQPISQKLGHKDVATTLNHYIDPTILEHFFTQNSMEMPKNILASDDEVKNKARANKKLRHVIRVTSKPGKRSKGEEEFLDWMNGHKLPNHPPRLKFPKGGKW